ncbi:DUF2063 domain-containing protein [Lysobacter pythonis]|uniref:DUF2063 domain-containing protein n=1 Tax=Solilutibacter pythonis TaxID=2483112 RepID=A0A3M2HT90_9GAMM|nr:putative DNA-binding domain-containing protein [Lysobacter pythonis]RMH92966.1 DUF2063 domain-containing protein [Lysobacter pythonis]
MSPDDALKARQFAFAAHLRDAGHPPPPGIGERRLAVYRTLFFNTIENLLAANFPVIRRTLGAHGWSSLVCEFHRHHRCQTPLFTEIAQEFIGWLAEHESEHAPWLPELAHYEWMELRAEIDDTPAPPHNAEGDPLSGIPVLSPQAWPLAYAWPVDRIGPGFVPETRPDTPTLLLVRRDPTMKPHFAALSPLAFRLLQIISTNDAADGATLLQALATEAGLPDDTIFLAEARTMLQRLRDEGTLIGTRPP